MSDLPDDLAAARREADSLRAALHRERVLRRLLSQATSVTAPEALDTVLTAVRDALQELGVPFEGCGVNLVDTTSAPPAVRFHAMIAGDSWHEIQAGTPGVELLVQLWQTQEVDYRRDLLAEDVHGEAARIRWRKPIRAVLDVPFSHGTLALNSTRPDPFTADHLDVVRGMGQVLSEAFTHQTRDLGRRRGALARIRGEMWNMATPEDVGRLVAAIAGELHSLGVPYRSCCVSILEAADDGVSLRGYHVTDGQVTQWEDPTGGVGARVVEQLQRADRPTYRRDLWSEDPFHEREAIAAAYDTPVRAAVDVPFNSGTLAVNSPEPEAFSDADIEILQGMAQVLSEGFQRQEELAILAQRTRELEERGRLLETFHHIGLVAQQHLTARELLDELTRLILETHLFRSLVAAIVDRQRNRTVELSKWVTEAGSIRREAMALHERDLDGPDIMARTVRSGRLQVVEGWDPEVYVHDGDESRAQYDDKIAYFLPVTLEGTVVAVLATASTRAEKAEMLRRIAAMQPLLEQVALAVQHAQLYEAMQREVAERVQAEQAIATSLAVQRLRNQILQMSTVASWDPVVLSCYAELTALVECNACSVNLVDLQADRMTAHAMGPRKGLVRNLREPVPAAVAEAVRTGAYVYRSSRRDPLFASSPAALPGIHSIVDVPFSGGTLAVNSTREDAFGDEDIRIIEQFAQVMSEALQRLEEIHTREAAQEDLRQYRRIVSATADLIALVDAGHIYRLVNDAYLERSGLGSADIVGRPAAKVMGRQVYEAMQQRLDRALAGETVGHQLWVEFAAAEPCYMDITCSPYRDGAGAVTHVVVTARDITERKQMEEKLLRLERMRVAGELSAGVSHNLNNMLTAVLVPAEMLLRQSQDASIRAGAETILTAGMRARDLVGRLHQSVRQGQESALGMARLDAQVAEVVRMARPRWKDEPESRGITIEVVTDLDAPVDIRGSVSELSDAVLNLLLNAVQAMPEGGTITITTSRVLDGVQLTVRDTGTGMDVATRRRVFEPFFTTKRDVGSGLGLSTVHGTVQRCGGTVEVDSTPGEGSTFTLWFPEAQSVPIRESRSPLGADTGRSGRLLIVDDDKGVCDVLDALLGENHRVSVVQSGDEALREFAPGQYDVALIDLGMPGMPGDQVARQMRQLDPSIATVLTTGWVIESDDDRLRWFDFQLRKPLADVDEVETVVARAIQLYDTRVEGRSQS